MKKQQVKENIIQPKFKTKNNEKYKVENICDNTTYEKKL